jgi:hypothetical protein
MSRYLSAFIVGAVALLAACSPTSSSSPSTSAPPGGSAECAALPSATIQQVTGTPVHGVARGSFPGAGGTCGNYTNADGEPYLGINRLTSQAEYRQSLAAVPDSIYPVRQALPGIGEEATLFSDSAHNPHLRYLVARAGDHGVVIFPFSGSHISDDQLRQLAATALN